MATDTKPAVSGHPEPPPGYRLSALLMHPADIERLKRQLSTMTALAYEGGAAISTYDAGFCGIPVRESLDVGIGTVVKVYEKAEPMDDLLDIVAGLRRAVEGPPPVADFGVRVLQG